MIGRHIMEGDYAILEHGMDECTIAALANTTGYPRTTIYMFYPTPLALFNDLAALHLTNMQDATGADAASIAAAPNWREATARVIHASAEYFRKHPVAAKLVLGPLTDSSHRAWEDTVMNLGRHMSAMLKARRIELRDTGTDACALALEFGASSFRFCYFVHGSVTPAYEKAAVDVIVSFLTGYIISDSPS